MVQDMDATCASQRKGPTKNACRGQDLTHRHTPQQHGKEISRHALTRPFPETHSSCDVAQASGPSPQFSNNPAVMK
eukprot:3859641-Amphidinium_carterae.1